MSARPAGGAATVLGIAARRKAGAVSPARLADFTTRPLRPGEAEGLAFSPYAIDPEGAQVVEVGVPAGSPPATRPFYYLDQFHEAQALRLTPAADYAEAIGLPGSRRRVFVFSVGRCGSTLVAKVFAAAGIASVSEPDVLLDLGTPRVVQALGLGAAPTDRLYAACLAALEARFGDPPRLAVKFRAQGSAQPHLRRVHRLFPDARFVVLFREPAAWARSCAETFGFSAETLRWLFEANLKAAEYLMEREADLQIVRYEEVTRDPALLLAGLLPGPERPDLAQALAATLGTDSQDGMFRHRGRCRPEREAAARQAQEGFLDRWRTARPRQVLARLGLYG